MLKIAREITYPAGMCNTPTYLKSNLTIKEWNLRFTFSELGPTFVFPSSDGSGRSGNRPSGRVGSGSGFALLCILRVGNFLANFKVIDLVEKIRGFRAC